MLKCLLEKEKKSTAWREGRGIIVTFLNVIKKRGIFMLTTKSL